MQIETNDFLAKLRHFALENQPNHLNLHDIQLTIFPGPPPVFAVRFDFRMDQIDFLMAKEELGELPRLEVIK